MAREMVNLEVCETYFLNSYHYTISNHICPYVASVFLHFPPTFPHIDIPDQLGHNTTFNIFSITSTGTPDP